MTPLKRKEYVRLKLSDMPNSVVAHYNLKEKADANGSLYVKISRGMYGLPQSGLLSQELLEKRLGKKGYYQSQYTPGLWLHKTRDIAFTLYVDDFGVKYVKEEDKQHLLDSLREDYDITVNNAGTRYLGITLEWDYTNRRVHLSMPGYVQMALTRFEHKFPSKPQEQPHPRAPPPIMEQKYNMQKTKILPPSS